MNQDENDSDSSGSWEDKDEMDEVKENVVNANRLGDPMELIDSGTFICKNGSTGVLRHFQFKEISSTLLDWIMDLMERNMKDMYNQSKGWNRKEKKAEMSEKTSRYLIAFVNEKPVAFTHFQFDMDYGREIVYCYEIQLEANARGNGLGKHIMKTLEALAVATRLSMVVLTVFKHNLDGIKFFNSVGYEIDETCPGEEEKKDYIILSKSTLTA